MVQPESQPPDSGPLSREVGGEGLPMSPGGRVEAEVHTEDVGPKMLELSGGQKGF